MNIFILLSATVGRNGALFLCSSSHGKKILRAADTWEDDKMDDADADANGRPQQVGKRKSGTIALIALTIHSHVTSCMGLASTEPRTYC